VRGPFSVSAICGLGSNKRFMAAFQLVWPTWSFYVPLWRCMAALNPPKVARVNNYYDGKSQSGPMWTLMWLAHYLSSFIQYVGMLRCSFECRKVYVTYQVSIRLCFQYCRVFEVAEALLSTKGILPYTRIMWYILVKWYSTLKGSQTVNKNQQPIKWLIGKTN